MKSDIPQWGAPDTVMSAALFCGGSSPAAEFLL